MMRINADGTKFESVTVQVEWSFTPEQLEARIEASAAELARLMDLRDELNATFSEEVQAMAVRSAERSVEPVRQDAVPVEPDRMGLGPDL